MMNQVINTEQENITKKRVDKLFWMRVVFAIIGGIAATFLFEGIEDSEEHRWTSIMFHDQFFSLLLAVIAKAMKINFPSRIGKKLSQRELAASYSCICLHGSCHLHF